MEMDFGNSPEKQADQSSFEEFSAHCRTFAAVSLASLTLLTGCSPEATPGPQSLGQLKSSLNIKPTSEEVVVVKKNANLVAHEPALQDLVNSVSVIRDDTLAFKLSLNADPRISQIPVSLVHEYVNNLNRTVTLLRSSLGLDSISPFQKTLIASASEQGAVVSDLIQAGRLTAKTGAEISHYAVDGNAEHLYLLQAKFETLLATLAKPK